MLFPLGDDNSSLRSKPVVTYVLIGANVFIFFLELFGMFDPLRDYGIVPADYFWHTLPYQNFIWTLFLHGGWTHLIFNMLFLYVFGDNVEDNFGTWRFIVFYFIAGICGSVAHIYFNRTSQAPLIGASGAISGVLGAYLLLFPKNQIKVFVVGFLFTVRAWIALGFWIGLQFFLGVSEFAQSAGTGEGIAHIAHIGGFLSGVLLVIFFRRPKKPAGLLLERNPETPHLQ